MRLSGQYPLRYRGALNSRSMTIINDCSIQTVFALCIAAASETHPSGGLKQCARQPKDTARSQFTFLTLNPGSFG